MLKNWMAPEVEKKSTYGLTDGYAGMLFCTFLASLRKKTSTH